MSEVSTGILCVDDEKNVIRSLQRLFLEENYEIFPAATAAEGLEILAREEGIQVVISDYRMPGMTGVEFLREVCQRWPETVRIVLSGYADTAAVVAAINEGQIYKFVPKPWNDEALKVTIANAIEMYQLQRQNRELVEELRVAQQACQWTNHQLEAKVQEQTASLLLKNAALEVTRGVLYALPIIVLGIDPDGMIAHWNAKGMDFLKRTGIDLAGSLSSRLLPEVVTDFLAECVGVDEHTSMVTWEGRQLRLSAARLDADPANGVVLAIWEEA